MSNRTRELAGYATLFILSFMLFLTTGFSILKSGRQPAGSSLPAFAGIPGPTATPFLPLTQTDAQAPEITVPQPLSGATHLASITNGAAAPQAELLPLSPKTINILLTGSDTRPGFSGVRTDTIMIISLDTDRGTVDVLSIPRDLYVYLPGHAMARINTAEGLGDTRLLAEAIQYNLGILTHYYIKIDFTGFISIVDALGGVEIDNERQVIDTCDLNTVRYPAGYLHLDGASALCYARVRKASSDFDRIQRQQKIVQAVFLKLVRMNSLTGVPDLYRSYHQYVSTDIDMNTVIALVPLAVRVMENQDLISFYSIGRSATTGYIVPESGAQVLLPDHDQIRELLTQIFSPD